MKEYRVNIDRGASVAQFQDNELKIPLSTRGLIHKRLIDYCGFRGTRQITPEMLDFLELGIALYYIDKSCPRGEREFWSRNFNVSLSLRNPDKFKKIESQLKYALTTLSGDNFSFEVTAHKDDLAEKIKPRTKPWKTAPTCVALLSGGIDSAGGALELLGQKEVPIFVRVNTHDKASISTLHKGLWKYGRSYLCKKNIVKLGSKAAPLPKETTQRARSYFFLTCATFLAATWGIERVYVNENGIMAIHIPLDPSRASTYSTRTVYPPFVSAFQDIAKVWLDFQSLKIENLFSTSTKSEVVKIFKKHGAENLLKETVSCAHAANLQQLRRSSPDRFKHLHDEDKHCGYCFPCILRRISVHNEDLSDHDVSRYGLDAFETIFKAPSEKIGIEEEASSAVIGLLRFIEEYGSTLKSELPFHFSNILECGVHLGANGVDRIVDFHDRFLNEFLKFINDNYPLLLGEMSLPSEKAKAFKEALSEENIFSILDAVTDKYTKPAETKARNIPVELKWEIQRVVIQSSFDVKKANELLSEKTRDWLKVKSGKKLEELTARDVGTIQASAKEDECDCPPWSDLMKRFGVLG